MTEAEAIAWTAGFLEGEGSFTAHHGQPRVTAVQTEREPLLLLKRLHGGTINRERRAAQGRQDLYQWYLGGDAARELMSRVAPLLSARRREQLSRALDGAEIPATRPPPLLGQLPLMPA